MSSLFFQGDTQGLDKNRITTSENIMLKVEVVVKIICILYLYYIIILWTKRNGWFIFHVVRSKWYINNTVWEWIHIESVTQLLFSFERYVKRFSFFVLFQYFWDHIQTHKHHLGTLFWVPFCIFGTIFYCPKGNITSHTGVKK